MRVHVVVGQLQTDWDPAGNAARTTTFLRNETGPGALVVLPEAMLSGYDDDLSGLAALDEGELAAGVEAVAAAARAQRVHVLCGTLWPVGGAWFNTALYFGPDGERWMYRKVNLATHERGRLHAGDTLPLLRLPQPPEPIPPDPGPAVPHPARLARTVRSATAAALTHPDPGGASMLAGGAVAIGVQLCRELRYPEQWHVLARRGASLLAYLTYAANPSIPAGVWRSHLVSRAAETQRFVVAANVASPTQHCPSMIISPRGEVLAESAAGAQAAQSQVLRADLDLGEVSDRVLSQQRADVVGISYLGAAEEAPNVVPSTVL
jgi:predicted amidohydrolase